MFPKSLSFSKKTNKQCIMTNTQQDESYWKKNSACVVIYLKLYNFY